MIYDESNGRNLDKVSKIYIWDMETNDWFDVNFPLPKVDIYKSFISKDLKNFVFMVLWSFYTCLRSCK